MRFIAALCMAGVLLFFSTPLYAQELITPSPPEFNPNFILDDLELADAGSMSVGAIQNFFAAEPGTLASYRTADMNGQVHTAAEIISNAATQYSINPKFLIVLLQKEQSLVEDPSPQSSQYDWATGFGVCDGCNTNDPALQQYRGFGIQVDHAAARQRYYLDHPTEFAIRVGQPYTIDDITITPISQATANLYIYTPHISGNENFWYLWQRYFARHYPDGTVLVDATTQQYWLLENGERREFLSMSTLYADYSANQVVTAAHADIERYDVGVPIKFPEYSLLRSPGGTIYLLVGSVRRGFTSHEAFRALGYNPDEVIAASWDDLNTYTEGQPITTAEANPEGALLQDKTTGGVFYVVDGVKHAILGRDILKSRFANIPLTSTSPQQLASYSLGDPAGFRDGALLIASGQPTVYVISNGLKRPIASEDVFNGLGYQWTNILRVQPNELGANPDGPVLTL